MPTPEAVDLDLIFCSTAKKYGFEKLQLKAVGIVESSLNIRAYRFEPAFFENYLKNNPEWKDKDPRVVSASFGIMQLMWTTACALGFPKDGTPEDLYNPVYNVELGAKLLRQLMDKSYGWWDVSLARYNGGYGQNPGPAGALRNQAYVDRVRAAYWNLRKTEENCE